MAIVDTERALGMFDALGMKMSGLILNQVYPRELLEKPNLSEFLKNRVEMQQHYLEVIREKFGNLVVAALPMYTREPKGLQMLAQVAEDLMHPKLVL